MAEWEGRIVGHALFLPLQVPIAGERVSAVALWVLTVAPGYQRRGIGSRPMEEGRRRARAEIEPWNVAMLKPLEPVDPVVSAYVDKWPPAPGRSVA